jgi:hypothetical protein
VLGSVGGEHGCGTADVFRRAAFAHVGFHVPGRVSRASVRKVIEAHDLGRGDTVRVPQDLDVRRAGE